MSLPRCPYCRAPLLGCPRGLACPGSHPWHNHPCPDCRWGLVCPTHHTHWPAGHQPPTSRTRTTATSTT